MLSVVIATHNNSQGCYLTALAVKRQLDALKEDYEVIIVADGGTEVRWEKLPWFRCARVNTGSPQDTRDAGIRLARGDVVAVLEDHVIVSDLALLAAQHTGLGAALTFPMRVAEGPELFNVVGHRTDWEGNLWHQQLIYASNGRRAHRVAQFGHSCFVVDREWYIASGGYTNLLRGWGGEEPFLCLKAWLLGRECWLVPMVWHAHHLTAGAHAFTPHLASNMLTVAYTLGGNEQLLKARQRYGNASFTVTPEVETERQRIVAGPFGGNLVKLRAYMDAEGIVN